MPILIFTIIIAFFTGSCAVKKPIPLIRGKKIAKQRKILPKKNKPKPLLVSSIPKTVKKIEKPPQKVEYSLNIIAILPLMQEDFDGESTEITRKVIYNTFLSTLIEVVPLEKVDRSLRKMGINRQKLENVSPKELGKSLGADTLLFGKVFQNYGLGGKPKMGIKLRLVDSVSEKVIWKKEFSGGDEVYFPKKSNFLPYQQVGNSERLHVVSDSLMGNINFFPDYAKRPIGLALKISDTLSKLGELLPEKIKNHKSPKIYLMLHDSPSSIRKLGDKINLFLKGTPGCSGHFNIGSYFSNIPLQEIRHGIYYGKYTIEKGDDIVFSAISGTISNASGISTTYHDVLGPVSFDTIPPAVPKNFSFHEDGAAVFISWEKNKENDLAGYTVLRSRSPFSGYKKITMARKADYKDKGLTYFTRYYYRLAALDKSGNSSIPSRYMSVTPVPPGPTYVTKDLLSENKWFRKSSPYIVMKNITIPEGSSLLIEPGTKVLFNEKISINVRGILYARGNEMDKIVFAANSDKKWRGITFESPGSEDSIIEWCDLMGATQAITLNSSSPDIDYCTISSNDFGIKVFNNSSPHIEKCNITDNLKTGVYITQGASPFITGCNISNNAQNGISIETSSPKITGCKISKNKASGIRITFSTPNITNNNIVDNKKWNILKTHPVTQLLPLLNNWWGETDCLKVFEKISGKVDFSSVLDAPFPGGKPLKLNILKGNPEDNISKKTYLISTFNPFIIEKNLYITKNAKMIISPGVVFKFFKDASITIKRGTVIAEGKPGKEILFTSNKKEPKPGDYSSALVLSSLEEGANRSIIKYCYFEYAQSGVVINSGKPLISHSAFVSNSQAGIKVFNNSYPTILNSLISKNAGLGGIYCTENAKAVISGNNIQDNSWAIQSFADNYINAVRNWWGSPSPPSSIFIGKIDYNPWLSAPNKGVLKYPKLR